MISTQEWEAKWWDTCQNTFGEELKQLIYARCMGITFYHDGKSPYNIDGGNRSVLDIGGGPVSLLLKCKNLHRGKVIDPLPMPDWVVARYLMAGVEVDPSPAEYVDESGWDEVWIYNCLQHVQDPEQVVRMAKRAGDIIRIFEWIETCTNDGHPHSLDRAQLDKWLGGYGKVAQINENTAVGKAYYGIFPTA